MGILSEIKGTPSYRKSMLMDCFASHGHAADDSIAWLLGISLVHSRCNSLLLSRLADVHASDDVIAIERPTTVPDLLQAAGDANITSCTANTTIANCDAMPGAPYVFVPSTHGSVDVDSPPSQGTGCVFCDAGYGPMSTSSVYRSVDQCGTVPVLAEGSAIFGDGEDTEKGQSFRLCPCAASAAYGKQLILDSSKHRISGPRCEHSHVTTCNGRGKLQDDFSCICDGFHGADCSGKKMLILSKGEKIAIIVIAGLVCMLYLVAGASDLRLLYLFRQRQRDLYATFGKQHPFTVKTLAGTEHTLTDWVACDDLRKQLAAENPDLGDWKQFVLQDANNTAGGTIDPKKGSKDRLRMTSAVLKTSQDLEFRAYADMRNPMWLLPCASTVEAKHDNDACWKFSDCFCYVCCSGGDYDEHIPVKRKSGGTFRTEYLEDRSDGLPAFRDLAAPTDAADGNSDNSAEPRQPGHQASVWENFELILTFSAVAVADSAGRGGRKSEATHTNPSFAPEQSDSEA